MFKLTVVVFLAFLACAFGGASKASGKAVAPAAIEENGLKKFVDAMRDSVKGQSISASIKDTNVDGLEGFNLKWSAPFKFQDYIVGFKYNLGDLKKAPESLFAKKSISTGFDGTATIDVNYELADHVTSANLNWASEKNGIEFHANGNTKDHLKSVGMASTQTVNGNKFVLSGCYDLLKSKFSTRGKLNVDDTAVEIAYDTAEADPVLSVSHKLDAHNTIAPSVSLKSGQMKYGWTRKWNGGSLASTFTPGDKVALEWSDEGANGVWKTTADIPLDDTSNTKVSFTRDWTY